MLPSTFEKLNSFILGNVALDEPLDVEAGLAELLGELAHLKNSSKVSNPEAGKQIFKPVNKIFFRRQILLKFLFFKLKLLLTELQFTESDEMYFSRIIHVRSD